MANDPRNPIAEQGSPDEIRRKILAELRLGSGGGGSNVSQGGFQALPVNNANGTELTGRPSATSGVRFYIAAGASMVYFIAAKDTTPTAPAITATVTPAGTAAIFDEPLAGDDSIYIVSHSGVIFSRWVA